MRQRSGSIETFKRRVANLGARIWIWIVAAPLALLPVAWKLAQTGRDAILLLVCLALALLGTIFVGVCIGLFAVEYLDAVGEPERWREIMSDPIGAHGFGHMLQDRAKAGPLGRELTEREMAYALDICARRPPPADATDGEAWAWADEIIAAAVRESDETMEAVR